MRTQTRTFLLFVNVAVWLGAASIAPLIAETLYWPLSALDQAKQKATSLTCVVNLRRVVTAAHVWANDQRDAYPTNFQEFAVDLASASPAETVLCPANHRHPPAANWTSFDWTRIDYEWMPQPNWLNPAAVCCRCLVHSNVAYADGHVDGPRGYRSGWPAVLADPLSQDATPGADVQFQVAITPDAAMPLSCQWRREQLSFVTNVTFVGDEISGDGYWATNRRANFTASVLDGQTNANLLLTNVQPADSDCYSVAVSNRLGVAVSSRAKLFVDDSVWSKTTNQYWSAVNCMNNLVQIHLFGRLWAGDHDDRMPPDLSVMTNAYGSPMFGWPVVLYCRADEARTVPPDWAGVDFNDTSYEVFPGDAEDMDAIFCRCKFHGFYATMGGLVVSRPSFTGIRPLPNDTLELSFTVFRGQTNLLEVSTDLVHWATSKTYSGTNGDFRLLETNSLPRRFYRIRTE